jgi:hypothetical protein
MNNIDLFDNRHAISQSPKLAGWFSRSIVGDLLGNCGDERSALDQASAKVDDYKNRIKNLKDTIAAKENGDNMKRYKALQDNLQRYTNLKLKLEPEINALNIERDTWEHNPVVAESKYGLAAARLGVRLTCNDYRQATIEYEREAGILDREIGTLESDLRNIEAKLAPDKMKELANQVDKQRAFVFNLENKKTELEKDIAELRKTRAAAKRVEEIAAAEAANQAKIEAEKLRQKEELEKKNDKQMKYLIIAGLIGGSLWILNK